MCAALSETSLGGARYYVSFIDDSTSYRYVYFIKHKIDAVECFITLDKLLRNKFDRRIKTLRTDNGKEYVNEKLTSYLKKQGITHERTAPYTPEQNGKAERENRTIVECARTMLNSADSPRSLWAEAVNTSVYLLECWCIQVRKTKLLMNFGLGVNLTCNISRCLDLQRSV